MAKLIIDEKRCKGCMLCVKTCLKGLLKESGKLNVKGAVFVEFRDEKGACGGCALCALVCPECCIEVHK
jgi:2-oxoglutarate ferredoxin oxidoreductase subunit delta